MGVDIDIDGPPERLAIYEEMFVEGLWMADGRCSNIPCDGVLGKIDVFGLQCKGLRVGYQNITLHRVWAHIGIGGNRGSES